MATEPSLPSVAERGIADARDGRTDSAEAGGRRKPCGEHGWVAAGPDGRTEPASGEPSDREAILDLVRLAVRRHAGGATAVLLADSAAGGTPLAAGCLPDSDLDVVAFTEKGRSRRLAVREQGVLIELFIVRERDYPALLREARRTGLPSLARMCRDGRVVEGGRRAEAFKRAAERTLRAGPLPVTFAELDRRRWELTELADDFRHAGRPEALFVAAGLLGKTAEFVLRANDRWLGVGKWALRALEEFDPAAARSLTEAAEAFFRNDDRRPLIEVVDRSLAPFGGPLREGWTDEARFGGEMEAEPDEDA